MDDYRRPEASEHYERAMALERAGRIHEALAEYRRAVDVDPGFAAAHEALGFHYQRRGLLTKAGDAFQTVARLEGHYNAHFNLGYVLVELERFEEALTAFQRCLELVPNDPAALYEVAYVDYILGHFSEALQGLEIPLEAYDSDWRVHNLMGACLLATEEWKKAEDSYLRALGFAASQDEIDEARAGLLVAQRYQEFPAGAPLGLKDRVYGDAGLALLGTAGDDGLHITPQERLALSPQVIAVTLRRLQALVKALDLDLSAVVAVDRESVSVAAALAHMLGLPRKGLSHMDPDERPLLVFLAGKQAEFLQVALEQAPVNALSFVLALEWYGESDLLPDFVGEPVDEAVLPQSPDGDGQPLHLGTQSLLEAVDCTPEEANHVAQVDYYRLLHRRLRFQERSGRP